MKQKKDQFIIVCLESADSAPMLMPYAKLCAEKLGKEIILMTVGNDGEDCSWIEHLGAPYVAMKGDWKVAISGLATALNGVLAITAVDRKAPRGSITHPARMLNIFSQCRSAYLCVQHPLQSQLHNVCLTLDHRRESKQKLIWGSYFVRFFGSQLSVASPDYSDAGLKARWDDNRRFLDKMYASLGIGYSPVTLASRHSLVDHPDRLALDQLHPDLLIALTTDRRDQDVGDWLLGTPERRLLQLGQNLLLLNQRDDLYVLCD